MKYFFLEMDKEVKLRQEIYNSKKYYFFIKYFADGGECYPMEIKPQVNVNDYDIGFNKEKNAITHITSRQLHTEIRFYDMTLNDIQGYVEGTILDIWTQQIDEETLNIVHIHVNDTSDQVTFDIAYMHDGEDISKFEQFSVDVSGRPLRYKILVKDQLIFKVLYHDDSN